MGIFSGANKLLRVYTYIYYICICKDVLHLNFYSRQLSGFTRHQQQE